MSSHNSNEAESFRRTLQKPAATPLAPRRPRGRPRGSKSKKNQPEEPAPRIGYRIAQFAAGSGLSRSTVARMIRDGLIKVVRLNRTPIIPFSEVERLMTPK
jgi:hypothetical protein